MKLKIVSMMLASAVGLGLAGAQAQTLNETFAAAYKNSQLLEQNRALLRATDEGAAVALSALRPVVSYVASATATEPVGLSGDRITANASISASLNIYDGGNADLGVEVAKENILATRAALRSLEQQVLLGAVTAFFNVLKAEQVVALQTNNLGLIGRELDASKDRFEVGEVTRTDVALAEARLSAVKSSLAAANGNLARAREAYIAAVGLTPRNLRAPSNLPRTATSLAGAKAVAVKSSPDIQQAKHNARVADLNILRADKAFGPSVQLSGTIGANQDLDAALSVSLSLSQVLAAGGQRSALYRQALAQQDAARAALLQSTLIVGQGVGNAWADLDVANASLAASAEQIKASQLAFDGLREEASLGARTTLDVLDAEQDLLDASTSQSNALNDRFIAAYALLASMGKLTVDQLNLGIVTYDPAAYYESIKDGPRQSDRGAQLDKVLKSLGKK